MNRTQLGVGIGQANQGLCMLYYAKEWYPMKACVKVERERVCERANRFLRGNKLEVQFAKRANFF